MRAFMAARMLALFRTAMPHRERYLFVCINRRDPDNPKGSCAQKGSEEIVSKLKQGIVARGAQKAVRVCSSSCLDMCETGVSIVQEPDHVAYGGVTLGDVDEMADALVAGKVVDRLVVWPKKKDG
jgi:(2Fe-2S) ferredoxin